MKTFGDLLALWPSDAAFARDIGVRPNHLQTMKARRSLPAEYWPVAVAASEKRSIPGVSIAILCDIFRSSRKPRESNPAGREVTV